jgi:hypothetical protein
MRKNFLFLFVLVFCLSLTAQAQINTIPNGGFENAENPAFWQKEDADDAVVVWATDQFRSPERSLKISESGGDDAPAWMSGNLATAYWNPVKGISPGIEMEVGGWVKTENVNTSPAGVDDEIHLSFSFYDSSDALIFDQAVVLNVPQEQASIDWIEIKNETPIVLPVSAAKMMIKFHFGKNATGTAWLDDIFMRKAPGAEGWLGSLYNANFGVPEGWFFWKDKMDSGEKDYGVVSITDKYAHRGSYSLRVGDTADNPAEVVAISNRNPIEKGRSYGLSAWVKLEGANVNPTREVEHAIFFTLTYHDDSQGWAELSGEDFFVVDQSAADTDWRLYEFTFTPPENATRVSIRARMQHQATGDTYWDDFRIYPVEIAKKNFSFDESLNPAYWSPRNAAGAVVAWASDQYRSPQKSLKISDDGGDDDPYWISTNMAKLNWNRTEGIAANIEIQVGGWVKTENVNTNPASAAEEIHLIYSFFDTLGNLIFDQPVVLNIPQDQASVDWTELVNDTPIVLPTDADSMIVMFHFGANATGTVWLDDIFMRKAPGAEGWIGSLYNANFGVPEGWFYWKDKMDSGEKDYGVVTVTDDYAHSGKYSLLISDTDDNPAEVVAISDRNAVDPDTEYLVSAWVKLENAILNPEEDVEKAIFFTVTYHSDDPGWAETHGQDFFVIGQTAANTDWALFSFRLKTGENDTRMSIRARMQHQATGMTYWDDFQVVPIAQQMAGNGFENAEMPAYWTKANESEATLSWTDEQARSPQRALMISDSDGDDEPMWMTNVNMAKLNWNLLQGIPPDIEIEVGGWVKTENVNTNPAAADEEIHLVFSFFDTLGNLIFDQPVMMNVPQEQASVDWTEIMNASPIVLPVDADSMAVKFHFGPKATGTVWLDDIFMRKAPGAEGWIGSLYNANFGVPSGWFYWKDKMDSGEKDYGVVSITDDHAFTGDYSLLVSDTADNPAEVVAISDRNPIEGNKVYTVEAWVKTDSVILNTENDVEKSIFFTVTYHNDSEGWAEISGEDFFVIDQSVTSKDWTLYVFTLTTPAEATRMSIRARLQHQATGRVYWDDFAVAEGNITRINGKEIELPLNYRLDQNYPNPFNPTTTIDYYLPVNELVELAVYNTLGEKVRTLIQGRQQSGFHQVVWDGRNDRGQLLSSGIYFYILNTEKARQSRRMVFIK